MKAKCERCGQVLPAEGEAYICSYECTFCPACVSDMHGVCRNCGGELTLRPQRKVSLSPPRTNTSAFPPGTNRRMVWILSFAVWGAMTLAASLWIYQYDRAVGTPMRFYQEIPLELSDLFTYAPLTPFVLALALRFPLKKKNWLRPLIVLSGGALLFTIVHVALRGATYSVWDRYAHKFVPAWAVHGHSISVRWDLMRNLFMLNWFNDVTSAYIPIVVVAYTVSSYQRLREREFRTSQLEAQLAKAHLESLKNQLRPHFLFNTMHSISALMHTDVNAADKMMCRLSDLLRMSLEDVSLQMTTLSRELEFVGGYLEIEKLRFEERLNVRLDIAGDTYDAEVPHLILQPLVENAVRHGIAKKPGQGELQIQAAHEGRSLLLRITDNGPGLIESQASASKSSLGIRSTRERLETLYGSEQSFSIRSLEQGGVEVTVRIPFRVDARPSMHETVAELAEPSFGT